MSPSVPPSSTSKASVVVPPRFGKNGAVGEGRPPSEPVSTFPVEVRDGDVYVDVASTLNGVTPS